MRLAKIKKRSFAVGLDWYVLEKRHESVNYAKQAAKIAEDTGGEILDMVALRPRQYGFGSSRGEAAYAKARALAASLNISGSFLGVFRFSDIGGDYWWVCAIKQSLVSAMGDKIFESEEKALASLPGIRDILGDFDQEVICDTVEKSTEWLSPLLIPDYLGRNRLRPVHGGPARAGTLKKFLLASGLILALVYGINTFLDWRTAQEAMRLAQSTIINKEKRKRELLAHSEEHFPRPWERAQPVSDFLHLCRNSMLAQPTIDNGWLLDAVSCDGKTLTVNWKHGPGATYAMLPSHSRLTSSKTAVAHSQLSGQPGGKMQPADYREFLGRDTVQRYLYQITQDAGLLLKFSGFGAPDKKIVEGIELTAPWIRGKWELTQIPPSLLLDSSFFKTLELLPGLTLTGFGYAKNIWSLKGEIYANYAKK